ncbi:hypothetical protein [Glacieibacterium sp.]|uniref:hypothetical protein n=1 Tax=Glacieibacterium sp. TaxID=2860237 RepID=UPI003B00CD74
MTKTWLVAPLLALGFMAPAHAAPPLVGRQIITTATVYGNDPCPTASNGDIVVCGRLPEAERFRIPPKLRKHKAERTEQPWSARVATLDDAARPERPDSCSAVGAGGQTGCTAAMLRQWADERRANGQRVGIPF